MEITDYIGYLLVLSKLLLIIVSTAFFISGIDDLFIDIWFWVRSLYRKFFVMQKYQALTEKDIVNKEEQPIAVMLPAWDEAAVIQPMLENTLKSINYSNFHIFVGIYPNDHKTYSEVAKVVARHDNVHIVVTPNDGPTNKADCLNWIYHDIKVFESKNNIRFEMFIMQDCEDVIHPLCYKLFNYMFPQSDMVQLPVLSLNRKWHQFTAGHYIDEFSQVHYKDMVVRESIDRRIPAAGVGVAFSSKALEIIAKTNNNQVFSVDSLTEDYDFGLRLKDYGLKQIFVKFFITKYITKKSFWTRKPIKVKTKELVCIREFFPASFKTSVRQKSRWVLGIAFQGWANLGWMSGLSTRYMLYRDRKAIVTNILNLVGYVVVLVVVGVWILSSSMDPSDTLRYPPLVEEGTLVWYILLANVFFLIGRVFHRAFCVQRFYGWNQAILSIPRMVWGNLINFFATTRAIHQYMGFLRTGKTIAWDKTEHIYPSAQDLAIYKQKIGEILVQKEMLTTAQLYQALDEQEKEHRLIGDILIGFGLVQHSDLTEALSFQEGA